jgi:hypothetical protein
MSFWPRKKRLGNCAGKVLVVIGNEKTEETSSRAQVRVEISGGAKSSHERFILRESENELFAPRNAKKVAGRLPLSGRPLLS